MVRKINWVYLKEIINIDIGYYINWEIIFSYQNQIFGHCILGLSVFEKKKDFCCSGIFFGDIHFNKILIFGVTFCKIIIFIWWVKFNPIYYSNIRIQINISFKYSLFGSLIKNMNGKHREIYHNKTECQKDYFFTGIIFLLTFTLWQWLLFQKAMISNKT